MSHVFILDERKIEISLPFEKYEQLPSKIKSSLYTDKNYIIKFKVSPTNFQNFMNCFKTDTKLETNFGNLFEYYLLSNEFAIFKEQFNEKSQLFYLSCLNYKFSEEIPKEISDSEEHVAMNLDVFIYEEANSLSKIPLNSLCNIFYHKKRVLRDESMAYNFIVKSMSVNKNICVLLNSLKDSNLKEEIVLDSLSKIEEHMNFCPQMNSIEDKIDSLKQTANCNDEIINFLFPQQNSEFEGKFILIFYIF